MAAFKDSGRGLRGATLDAARRNQYLRKEQCLLATAGDREWQAPLHALAGTTAQNRWPVEKSAWAAQR